MSYIDGYLVEINQFPRFGERFTIKSYFYYNSNTKEYGYRDTVIPKEQIINNDDMTEELVANIINNNIPAMRRVIDPINLTESWIFEPTA
jgi:hypothetical protein